MARTVIGVPVSEMTRVLYSIITALGQGDAPYEDDEESLLMADAADAEDFQAFFTQRLIHAMKNVTQYKVPSGYDSIRDALHPKFIRDARKFGAAAAKAPESLVVTFTRCDEGLPLIDVSATDKQAPDERRGVQVTLTKDHRLEEILMYRVLKDGREVLGGWYD